MADSCQWIASIIAERKLVVRSWLVMPLVEPLGIVGKVEELDTRKELCQNKAVLVPIVRFAGFLAWQHACML